MPLATVFGCSGTVLTDEERAFFRDADPLGFILFARNVETPDQVRALTEAMRKSVGREDAPILIDQEGGRVARLKPPHWREAPAAGIFGRMAAASPNRGTEAARINARLMAGELLELGITVNCAPVLDIPQIGAHDVIGDRAPGKSADIVIIVGRAIAEGLLGGGVLPVIKHLPGHGRATVDSHNELPVVDADLTDLHTEDFSTFRALRDMPLGMTGHILFTEFDENNPSTTSHVVVESVIRSHIGFDGLLISDDLSMNALSGTVGERAAAALAAGCDVALHCNGKMDEMKDVAANCKTLSANSKARLSLAEAMRRPPEPLDREAALNRLTALLEGKAH
ncbi:MAG: beta-N-acetylhexosaminidase [Rhodospirillales bacterium]|nr:beta-N-acetylhexosaminidase [Rhodospirillales bacterium]